MRGAFLRHSLTLTAVLILLSTGCSDLKTVSYMSPPSSKLRKYSSLEIATFETDIINVPERTLTEMPEAVAKAIEHKQIGFKQIVYGDRELPFEERTLVMFGNIVNYQSGRDIKTEGGALKFAEASITVRLSLVDKATGREITNGEVNSSSSFGFLRSGVVSKGVYSAIAEEIANFVRESY